MEEQDTSQASSKISEGVKMGWERITPLKKKNCEQNCFILHELFFHWKAVLTRLERFCNLAEHASVELLP